MQRYRDGNPLERPIHRPSGIPADDFSAPLRTHRPEGKPIGFGEAGWFSDNGPFGGEQAQADFIGLIAGPLTRGQGLDLCLFDRPWLHDPGATDSVGLLLRDGTPKLAYEAWLDL